MMRFWSTIAHHHQASITWSALPGCRLWAQARHAGTPTAAPSELDCDVLLAAQALTLEVSAADRVIATTNVGHLAQFVAAELWTQIAP